MSDLEHGEQKFLCCCRGRLSLGDDANPSTSLLASTVSFIIKTTLALWVWVKTTLLPTPAKFHYIFSLVDLSRVFQGIMRVPAAKLVSETLLAQVTSLYNSFGGMVVFCLSGSCVSHAIVFALPGVEARSFPCVQR